MELKLTKIAETTLRDRYLLRDEHGNVIETNEQLFNRVGTAIAKPEADPTSRHYWGSIFTGLMTSGDFMPNTPTLMNAGLAKGQLSACFVLPVEDTIEGIFETLKIAAKVHQSGGGTGFCFSRLRPKDAVVDSKQGVASGPISFAKIYDAATETMKQGGKRKGANMYNKRIDHPDIIEFIDAKRTKGILENFNVSVTITDAFMEAVKNDEEYELYHEKVGVVGTLKARDVWRRIAENAHASAEPGIIFIDRVNARSPYEELIEATNPCGEQPLPPWGACNLGSINLANFVKDGELDYERLRAVTRHSVRFLDNVIDANHWPHENIKKHADKYRNIGLGIMGWADALIKLRIPYNSTRATALAEEVQFWINFWSHQYSVELGVEKGLPSGAPFKTFFDYSSPLRRNATLTTVAPTGSISMIAGCSSGIEPIFAFAMERHQLGRVMMDYHPLYAEWIGDGQEIVRPDYFVESHEVEVEWHVDMQAAFQKHCDSAISKTINLPSSATVEDVLKAYERAYESGCKGMTVYVDGSREGVLHRKELDEPAQVDTCCDSPNIVNEAGCETCYNCGTSKCLIA